MSKVKNVLAAVIVALSLSSAVATDMDEPVCLSKVNITGPRMGMTGVVGHGKFYDEIKSHEMNAAYSQFGWHFEFKVAPDGYTPSFVFEIIPLIGGIEYGLAIPSLTLPIGVRLQNGFELGMGPNLVMGYPNFSTSIVIAAGKTFSYHGVGLPINIAVATGKGGTAASLLFGYAIVKSKERIEPMASGENCE